MDLGAPASYLTLREGTPVLSADGQRIGVVGHVLADAEADVFDGIVIDTGRGHRFVETDPRSARSPSARCGSPSTPRRPSGLPEPSANPATLAADPAEHPHGHLSDKLRRAWDLISGKSDYGPSSSRTERMLPAGSRNQAIGGPSSPRAMPLSSCPKPS